MPNEAHTEEHNFRIEIDGAHYTVTKPIETGSELRAVPTTPIGPDRDLFQVVPGGQDRKIADTEVIEIRDGDRFITAERVHKFQIQIDRVQYTVTKPKMTGLELRAVPPTPIGPDRDLFEVVPGVQERKIGDNEVVEIRDGEQFITAERVHKFQIQIDRVHYTVTKHKMTGLELRAVPPTPIGPDRDLFEVVPGGQDRKIGDNEVVEIRDGERFFTAPAHINPGRSGTIR